MNQKNSNQSKNNLTAIFIGFSVVIFVAVLILSKIYFSGEKKETNIKENEEIQQEEEKDIQKYNSINSQNLFKKMSSREDFEIIDLRENNAFKNKHIKNSKNISSVNPDTIFESDDKEKEYILVDDFGLTSSEIEIMNLFLANGFENISYLEGGISAWENNYPLITIGDPYSFTDQSKVTYIKSDELKNILDLESNYLYILDLRESSEFLTGHLKNAVNIPLDFLEEKYREIPSGKKIILYSEDNLAAFQGAVRLFDLGFFNVFTLSDGLNGWKQKGFEIVK